MNWQASMWLLKAAYIVDDQPRCVGGQIWIVTIVIHGADTYIDIPLVTCIPRRYSNEHSSSPSSSSPFVSLICTPCPETSIDSESIQNSINVYVKRNDVQYRKKESLG
jgi:hypothetical protein